MANITLGIDGRCFVGPAAGTTHYVRELGLALQGGLNAPQVLVYGQASMKLPPSQGWHARTESHPVWRGLPATLWYRWRTGGLAAQDGVSVFLAGANFLPAFRWQRSEAVRNDKRMVSILVVHDVVAELFPRTLTWSHRLAHRLFLKSSINRCDLLVVNSHGTASRVQARFGRKPDLVVRPPIDRRFQPQDNAAIAKVQQEHQLPKRYILAVGTIEPRKNLGALIQACVKLTLEGHDLGALVIAGSQGWLTQATNAAVVNAQASGLDIRLLGQVLDTDLPALYAGAELFVLPSLYEGFGMSVAEALSCGTRVLATDMPETREAGGEHSLYCLPTVDGLRLGILQALAMPAAASSGLSQADCVGRANWADVWACDVSKLVDLIRSQT